MKRLEVTALLAVAALVGLTLVAQAEEKPVTPEQLAKIEAALPSAAQVQPAVPRKLLVFKLCKGFVHGSIPCGAKAIELLGQKTGAYSTTISEDPAMFAPDSLAQFDAVLMLNTTGTLFDDAALKESFLNFVKGGKGLAGIHAATDCFYDWADYGDMIGGYFDGHPWGANDTVGVKLEDPAHPVCEAFLGRGFKIKDEIYQFNDTFSREKVRVLLSLDPATSDMTKKGIKRTDGDFPIAWIKTYGAGRVFYCSLGHNESTYWNPAVLKHYLSGIQYALGDLPADAMPSAQLSAEYLADSARLAQSALLSGLLGEIAHADYGQARDAFTALAELADTALPETAGPIADALAALLDTDATLNAKQFATEHLSVIGTEAHVPALAKLLSHSDTVEMGRYALQRITSPAANQALIEALATVEMPAKAGIVTALGERRDPASVAAIAPLASDSDLVLASAAVSALGNIATPDAVQALAAVEVSAPKTMRAAVTDAYLKAADLLLEGGAGRQAAAIYGKLYAPTEALGTRLAAFRGLLNTLGDKASPLVIDVLQGDDVQVQRVAIEAVRDIPGDSATAELAASLPNLAPSVQVALINALAARGDKAALGAVTEATTGSDEAVRIAALEAIAALGGADSVEMLANAAAGRTGAEAEAARASLYRLPGSGVDARILDALANASPPATHVELARALAERRTEGAVPGLLGAARDEDAAVRVEALKSLALLAKAQDVPSLFDLLSRAEDDATRKAAADAIVAAIPRNIDDSARSAIVESAGRALRAAEGNAAKLAALIKVFGRVGDPAALPILRRAAASDLPEVRDAAVRALTDWPTAATMSDVRALAADSPDAATKALAFRGYVRMIGLRENQNESQTLAKYEDALAIAATPEDKKLVLAALGDVRDPRVKDVLQPFLADPVFEAEANAAAEKLASVVPQASASSGADSAPLAMDGHLDTRWGTGEPQKPGQWFMVDFGWERTVSKVTLDTTPSPGDYPRGYEVYVFSDPAHMGQPVASGAGQEGQPILTMTFEPKTGRFLRIVQTGEHGGLWWSIHELTVE